MIVQLGLWRDFAGHGHLPCFGSRSLWSDNQAHAMASISSPFGHGWHLDRKAFEVQLRNALDGAGIHILRDSTPIAALPDGRGGWAMALSDGTGLHTRFVVDASGRHRAFSRLMGQSTAFKLPQCAMSKLFPDQRKDRPGFEIEATDIGWWYRAPLPDGNCIVTLITDRSLWPRAHQAKATQWQDAFMRTTLCSAMHPAAGVGSRLMATNADVSLHPQVAGANWLAAGDAAFTLDPLSGSGIEMALRGGIKAAHACACALSGDGAAVKHYIAAVQRYFQQHIRLRKAFYGMESRWPNSDFWQKRQHENLSETAVFGGMAAE